MSSLLGSRTPKAQRRKTGAGDDSGTQASASRPMLARYRRCDRRQLGRLIAINAAGVEHAIPLRSADKPQLAKQLRLLGHGATVPNELEHGQKNSHDGRFVSA